MLKHQITNIARVKYPLCAAGLATIFNLRLRHTILKKKVLKEVIAVAFTVSTKKRFSEFEAMEGEVVCVTGATGYIAGHLIKQLLERGYRVRGTVRNIKKSQNQVKFLYSYCKYENQLSFYEADLMIEHSFDEVVQGSKVVYHVASPFTLTSSNPELELVKPAVNGVLNVLSSSLSSHTVEKVVMTSSIAAIFGWPADLPDGFYFTEEHWNTSSSLSHGPYYYSKLCAEKAAWKFMEENKCKFKLVCINPSVVIGPLLSTQYGTSVQLLIDLCLGRFPLSVPRLAFGFVDVRDVAKAHILAGESANAEGRYICHSQSLSMFQICQILLRYFPQFPIPKREIADALVYAGFKFWGDKRITLYDYQRSLGRIPLFDNTKIQKDLKMKFIPIEQSIIDTTESFMQHGILPRKYKKSLLSRL